MTSELIIAGKQIPPGTKAVVPLVATTDLSGWDVTIWAHVIAGRSAGPTLGLFSMQHGDEWHTFELLRRVVQETDPAGLKGNLIVMPVCNPLALCAGQRVIQPKSDGIDLNRVWPGVNNWLAEAIAKVLDRELVRRCDVIFDFHHGPFGTAFGEVAYGIDYDDADVVARGREIGIAFGYPRLMEAKFATFFPGPRSLMGYGGAVLKIPTLGVEIGGIGFSTEQEHKWGQEGYRGIRNVMIHLDMLEGTLQKPERILTYTRSVRIDPRMGGMLVPEREPDQLHRAVKQGELLARIVSPHTFEELERLEAPCDGWLKWISRTYPVRPGGCGFGLAAADSAEWITP